MARFNQIHNSFFVGEVSPKISGRTDLDSYRNAADKLENMLVIPQGGATRRLGTRYHENTLSDNPARLVPFVVSQTEAYVVEFTNNGIRVIPSDLSTTLTVGSGITINNSAGLYTTAQAFEIQYTQSVDVLYIVHPSVSPKLLKRTGANTFEWEDFDSLPTSSTELINRIPFRDPNTDSGMTLASSSTTGTVTLTASGFTFDSNQVGGYYKLTHSGTTGAVKLTAYLSSTTMTAEVINTLGSTSTTDDWEESSWSDFRGWPRATAIFEGRLFYGGNTAQPDTFWASKLFNFEFFQGKRFAQDAQASEIVSDDPFQETLSSDELNAIQWLSSGKTLVAGTSGAEFILKGTDPNVAIGPDNKQGFIETTFGSACVQARRVAGNLVFIQNGGNRVREFVFDNDEDAYKAEDLTILSDHLLRRNRDFHGNALSSDLIRVQQIEYQKNPYSILWCVDNNGGLFTLTRDKDQGIGGWAIHSLGGKYDNSGTDESPLVRSVCVIPTNDGTDVVHNYVFMSVTRTVNGSDVNFVEYIGKEFDGDDLSTVVFTDSRPVYSDAAKIVSLGSPGTAFTGFSHLEGETVSILVDGKVHANKTVSSGTITLDYDATEIIAGLPFTPVCKPSRPEAGSVLGTSQGVLKRIHEITIRFYRTVGAKYGPDASNLKRLQFRDQDLAQDADIPVFTGDKTVKFHGSYEREGFVYITHDQPLPLTVLSVISKGETYD